MASSVEEGRGLSPEVDPNPRSQPSDSMCWEPHARPLYRIGAQLHLGQGETGRGLGSLLVLWCLGTQIGPIFTPTIVQPFLRSIIYAPNITAGSLQSSPETSPSFNQPQTSRYSKNSAVATRQAVLVLQSLMQGPKKHGRRPCRTSVVTAVHLPQR